MNCVPFSPSDRAGHPAERQATLHQLRVPLAGGPGSVSAFDPINVSQLTAWTEQTRRWVRFRHAHCV